jgi:hypothetical protein
LLAIKINKKRNKMANAKQLTARYIEFIANEVVNNFGGSYQTYDTLGKVWRQKLEYSPKTEQFLIDKTKFFLRMLDGREQSNFNLMYNVCYGIGDYLSKYLIKKSADLIRTCVTDSVVNDVFLTSERFITKFQATYKKPINMENSAYVASNPGVVAMYVAVLNSKQCKK